MIVLPVGRRGPGGVQTAAVSCVGGTTMGRRERLGRGSRRGRRVPRVEGLESRELLSAILTEFDVPTTGYTVAPGFAATGPDGNLYFSQDNNVVSRFTFTTTVYTVVNPTTGAIAPYTPPASGPAPWTPLAHASDGNDWYVPGGGGLAYVNPASPSLVVPVATPGATPTNLVAAPGGSLFFTDTPAGKIGQIDPTTHAVVEYPLAKTPSAPNSLVLGPDGKLWFAEYGDGAVGSIDPTTHAVAEYALPSPAEQPSAIMVGPDHDLWFLSSGLVGKIDPTTHAVTEYRTIVGAGSIADGPDGQVWFTARKQIGEVNPATGAVSLYAVPNSVNDFFLQGLSSLTAAPDGTLWAGGANQVDKVTIIPANQAAIQGLVTLNTAGLSTTPGPIVAGQVVYLDLKGDGRLDPGDPTAVTDGSGYYTFTGLAPGTYTIRVAYPGNITTYPAGGSQTVTVAGGGVAQFPALGIAPGSAALPLAYNANPFGSHNPDVSTAEVVGLFKTILNRAPDPASLTNDVAYLKGGGSLQSLASILLHSDEYEGYVVASDYSNILGRAASPAEVAAWVRVIDQQHLTAEQVSYYFLTSPEFNAAHADNASFIAAVYEDVLGRPAAAFEVSAWQSVLASGASRSAMVDAMIHSTFAAQRAAEGLATIFWGTTLGAADEAFVVNYLVTGGNQADLASAFASLPGFVIRANASVG